MVVWFVAATTIASSSLRGCLAWQGLPPLSTPIRNQGRRWERSSSRGLYSMRTDESSSLSSSSAPQFPDGATTDNAGSVLEGVEDFESWFSAIDGSSCNPYIRHDSFGSLRGLGTRDRSIASDGDSSSDCWMRIPRSVTLSSDFRRTDWDAALAESLWKEVVRGKASPVRGYVSLLTKSWTAEDLPDVPPYPAPDALRHWTDDEREALAVHPEGQALLDLQRKQEGSWRAKHEALSSSSSSSGQMMTWEQFEWAMEAVHSRAFCGDFGIVGGGGRLPAIANLGAPAVAALASYIYFVPLHGQSDGVLLALALLGAIPSAINLLRESTPVAVLLPLIDSANHLESADSSIRYSPLTDSFELVGGPSCIVAEEDGMQQLYISYGTKSDKELLLNYGFLNGTTSDDDGSKKGNRGNFQTERRRMLAEAFVENK